MEGSEDRDSFWVSIMLNQSSLCDSTWGFWSVFGGGTLQWDADEGG